MLKVARVRRSLGSVAEDGASGIQRKAPVVSSFGLLDQYLHGAYTERKVGCNS